jgi:putative SOS response-associated peptidase YedK
MCGRFLLRTPPEEWPADLLNHREGEFSELRLQPELTGLFEPRQNIAPTQAILAIVQPQVESLRELRPLRWGLVPSWAKDRGIGAKMINARAETVDEKPSFRTAFSRQRCLIPADGYYEWITTESGKQPMLIEQSTHQPYCFAGLWEQNRSLPFDKDSEPTQAKPLVTCTIITTAANPSMASIHDRMPVVIEPANYGRWLDPGYRDVKSLKSLLIAAEEGFFTAHPVAKVSGR